MNNLSKEKKQQLILVAVITLIIAGVMWVGLISSQQKALADTRKKTAEMQQKVDTAEKLIKQAAVIEEELDGVQARLQQREETMASGDLYQWFLSKMIPATSSKTLDNFNSSLPGLIDTRLIPKFPYRSATYSVKLAGNYNQFGKFLADMENEFPYAHFQNVDITPASASANAGEERLSFSFEFVTLYHTNRAVSVR